MEKVTVILMLHERVLASNRLFPSFPSSHHALTTITTMSNTLSDLEHQLTDVFSKHDYVEVRALRDILAPSDLRDAAKLIEAKKLRDARKQLESNGVVAVRSSSDGKFEVHVDLALEYVLYKNKDLKQFVTHTRNNRPGGIRGVLESTPGLFERVKTVFGDKGLSWFFARVERNTT